MPAESLMPLSQEGKIIERIRQTTLGAENLYENALSDPSIITAPLEGIKAIGNLDGELSKLSSLLIAIHGERTALKPTER